MTGGEVTIKQRVREILRFTGVLLPSVLVLYGWFVDMGTCHFIKTEYAFSAVMIPWLALSLIIFIFPAKRSIDVLFRLGAYHLFAGAYIVLLSGFSAPFVVLGWVLLLLVSYIYLARLGVIINLLALVVTALADSLLADNREQVISNIVAVSSLFIIGTIIVALNKIQQADSEELLRSKAQESLQIGRMNTLINNLADAVITLSNEGQVEIYNAASLNLLNTNVGFQKQSIDDVIKVHDQSGEPVKLFEVAKKAKGVKIRDDLLLVNDDETIRLEVTSSPVRSSYSRSKGNSSADGYILILRDITKSKSLEEERDEFISVVSHELRTPITVVEGTLSNVQLMVKKGKTPPGTLERSLADAHDQIMFLSRMVNDLSTLSRAERGVADTAEPIDVRSMIDSLYKEYSPQADKKNLHFNIDTSGRLGTVTASHLYLRELLQNMITNAIKYTKEGSVTLSAARSGDHIAFTVKDTGIGISKSDQTKIFNKFYRSEDYRTRETGGTGLGLYVAAKLAKKLGTSIEVKSRLNHGSSFSFTMPVDSKTKS
jgi:signal transduction histidine kinase